MSSLLTVRFWATAQAARNQLSTALSMLHFGTGVHPPRGRRLIQTKPRHVVWEVPLPREKEPSSDCTQVPLYSGWWHWTFPSANHSAQNIPNNQISVGGIN